MNKILIFAVLAAFAVACGGSEEGTDSSTASEKSAAPTPTPATVAVDAEKVYKTNCLACHGLYGDMGAAGAYNLQTSELNLEERIDVITNGRNAMAAWGSILKEEEIKAVAEYTFTLKPAE